MKSKHIFFTTFISLVVCFFIGQATVNASSTDNLFGNAWSGNIGWISFNNCTSPTSCTGINYGVTRDVTTGNLSGYAWSDNIGWISFNATSGCPFSGCTTQPNINTTTGTFTGYARAVSNGAGWDGWIDLSGPVLAPGAGTRTISGYSWGSDVIGWIDMSGVTYGGPGITVTISASPTTLGYGVTTSTITWSSTNASSCEAIAPPLGINGSSSWTSKTTTSDSQVVTGITSTTSYYIRCSNGSSSETASTMVTPAASPLLTITSPYPSIYSEPDPAGNPTVSPNEYGMCFTLGGTNFTPSAPDQNIYVNISSPDSALNNTTTNPRYFLTTYQGGGYYGTGITRATLTQDTPLMRFKVNSFGTYCAKFTIEAPISKSSPACPPYGCTVVIDAVAGIPPTPSNMLTPAWLTNSVTTSFKVAPKSVVTCVPPQILDPITNLCVDPEPEPEKPRRVPKPIYKEN